MGNNKIQAYESLSLEAGSEDLCDIIGSLMIANKPTSRKLESALMNFQISEENLYTVRQNLGDSKDKDVQIAIENYRNALQKYDTEFQKNNFIRRKILEINGKYKKDKPDVKVVASVKTELLNEMVISGERINTDGKKLIFGIPALIKKNQEKYSKLEKKIEEHKKIIFMVEKNKKTLQSQMPKYELIANGMENYYSLSESEKNKIIKLIKNSGTDAPDLDYVHDRDKLLEESKVNLGIFDYVEILSYSIISFRKQMDMIVDGVNQINQSYMPAVRELEKHCRLAEELELVYDNCEAVESSAGFVLEAPEERIRAEGIIRKARKYLEEKTLDVEAKLEFNKDYSELNKDLQLERF